MKRVLLLTMVLFFSAAVLAQQTEVPIPDGLVIPVEIKKTLNPKKVQVGDPVALEVTKDVRGPDGEVLIPKRAKAAGRVTAVQARTKEQKVSALSFVVESVTWKTGSAKLKAFISGDVRPPEINPEIRASSNPAGVGVLGTQQSTGAAVYEGLSAHTGAQQAATPDSYKYVGAARTTGIRATGIADVALAGSEDPNVVSVLMSDKTNVVLESGSTMTVRQWTNPAAARPAAQAQPQPPKQQ
jgi:hypothetical protein